MAKTQSGQGEKKEEEKPPEQGPRKKTGAWFTNKKDSPAINRMPWHTNSEDYGKFSPSWNRTYLTNLPSRRKRAYQDKLQRRYPTSQSEYGNFYTCGTDRHGYPTYQLNRSFMLPVLGHYDPAIFDKTTGSPVAEVTASSEPCQGSVHLPDIKGVNLKILTKDKARVDFKQGSDGRYDVTSYPKSKDRFRLPEVEEVHLRFHQKDGHVYNIRSRPQPQ